MNEKVLAFVIDGVVQRVIRFDEETSAILLSNPTVVDITNAQVTESWNYEPGKGFYIVIDGEESVIPV